MKKVLIASSVLFLVPLVALAADLGTILGKVAGIIDGLTPVVVGLALLFFFWGLALFILNAGDEEKRSKGRSIMIWGVIAIFVILTVFGLVSVLQETFSLESDLDPDSNIIPSVDFGVPI